MTVLLSEKLPKPKFFPIEFSDLILALFLIVLSEIFNSFSPDKTVYPFRIIGVSSSWVKFA